MPKDGKAVFEMVNASRSSLREWFSWVEQVKTMEDSEKAAQLFYADFIQRISFNFLILKGTELLGSCGFNDPWRPVLSVAIGYYVHVKKTGRGYIRESVTAFTRYAFEKVGFRRVVILCDDKNLKSAKVAEDLDLN